MTAIARSQSSSKDTPILDAWVRNGGFLVDPYSLSFRIYDTSDDTKRLVPVQVFPADPAQAHAVDLTTDKVGLGHFAAAWTASAGETLGRHMIRWYLKLASTSTEWVWTREFEVLAGAGYGAEIPSSYCMLCDLREQGISAATYSDARVLLLANEASRFVERCTGRHFDPRALTLTVDGAGGPLLMLDTPIIGIDDIVVLDPWADAVDISDVDYRVYNRHLSKGMLLPDDRDNPKVELTYGSIEMDGDEAFIPRLRWPKGSQNISITGAFGYTDPDGSPAGCTPREISKVTMMLVYRDLLLLTDADRDERTRGHLVTSMTTRDQQVMMKFGGDVKWACTAFTGDPAIDTIIARYRRPATVCGV